MNTENLSAKIILFIAAILLAGILIWILFFLKEKFLPDGFSSKLKLNSIEVSSDAKSILESESGKVIFNIEDANKYFKSSGYASEPDASQAAGGMAADDCFLDAVLSNSGEQIIFSTGCPAGDLRQPWIGIYNIKWKSGSTTDCAGRDCAEIPRFKFLINGSGKGFAWSVDDEAITYESVMGLSGMTKTRSIDSSTREVVERKNIQIISDWKTYASDTSGFEIKYPNELKAKEYYKIIISKNNAGSMEVKMDNLSDAETAAKWQEKIKNNLLDGWTIAREYREIELKNDKKNITITIDKNPNNYSAGNWIKTLGGGTSMNWEKEISVNGKNGLLGGFGCCESYRQTFVLPAGDNIFVISGGYMDFGVEPYGSAYDYEEDFKQLISTFRIVEKNSVFSCGNSEVGDSDNNSYKTVKIGYQCWMKENLKVSKNPKGKVITRYCYDNDPKNCNTGGGLYDWDTAMNNSGTEGAQGICPDGWHIPKDAEWDNMENLLIKNYLKETGQNCFNTRMGKKCAVAGIELRSGGSSGFDTIFSGNRNPFEAFSERGSSAYLWSSTKIFYKLKEGGSGIWYRKLNASDPKVSPNMLDMNNNYAFSVRCLKD